MQEPLIEFKDIKQAYECLHEWQKRLFLNDWIIKVEFKPELENAFADVAKNTDTKTAFIRIRPKDEESSNKLTKYCAEKSLVHELCHIALDTVDYIGDNKPAEVIVFEYIHHQRIEQMAKSFIMTKYGIDFDWFKNFKEDI